jgi:hypothetical protein
MDCDLARRILPFSRSGGVDLDPGDRAALSRHLAACPACAAAGAADRAFDAGLAAAMRAVSVPDGLPVRLHNRMLAARWAYFSRVFVQALLAITILILACYEWLAWSRPVLDPQAVAQQAYQMSGLSRANEDVRIGTSEWLGQFSARLEAPDEFNYQLLSFTCRSEFQGLTRVPTLVFASNGATMRVFVVREFEFKNLAAIREPIEDGGCTVDPRRYENQPGWVFILVTSGAPPDAFRRPNRPLDPA